MQPIFESKGDKLSFVAECRIRSCEVWETRSQADWMPTHKPTIYIAFPKKRVHSVFLIQWGRKMHTCINILITIDSAPSHLNQWCLLSTNTHKHITTKDDFLSTDIHKHITIKFLIVILILSFKKTNWNILCATWRPFCFGFDFSNVCVVFLRSLSAVSKWLVTSARSGCYGPWQWRIPSWVWHPCIHGLSEPGPDPF